MINPNEMGGSSEKEPEKNAETSQEGYTKFEDLTPEQQAQYHAYMEANPEPPVVENKIESGPKILEVEALFAAFEEQHPVEELMAVTFEEARKSPVRLSAMAAANVIGAAIKKLESDTEISEEKLKELKLQFQTLKNPIGTLCNIDGVKTIDHTRY